jgi:hypothetical protein
MIFREILSKMLILGYPIYTVFLEGLEFALLLVARICSFKKSNKGKSLFTKRVTRATRSCCFLQKEQPDQLAYVTLYKKSNKIAHVALYKKSNQRDSLMLNFTKRATRAT